MRVSTSFIHTQSVRNMLQQQTDVIRTQQQLATGKQNLVPSDDPSTASRILDLNDALNKLQQYGENSNFATQRLSVEESVLASVENLLQRVRELTVQAGNSAVLDVTAKEAIAEEITQLNEALFDLANTKDVNGEYLFSGFQTGTQPFTIDAAGNYIYNGDQGELALQIGDNRQVVTNDSGADVFQLIRNGNGSFITDNNAANTGNGLISTGSVQDPAAFLSDDYTIRFTSATTFEVDNNTTGAVNILGVQTYTEDALISFDGIEVAISQTPATGDSFSVNASRNQSIMTTLSELVNSIFSSQDSFSGDAQYAQGIATALNNIDRSMDNIINTRTKVGARLNSIDMQIEDNDARQVQFTSVKSQIEDLDYAEAISRLTFQSTALQASQQTFALVKDLNLFNFI